jgi:hypothetical protein
MGASGRVRVEQAFSLERVLGQVVEVYGAAAGA